MQTALESKNRSTPSLSYEEVCQTLKFYCGYNPKKEENIKSMIAAGLPTLTNVSVKVEFPGYVTIWFDMPYDRRKKFKY